MHLSMWITRVPTPMGRPWGFWDLNITKSPPSFAPFVSESPLFSSTEGQNLFILNVRTAPGSEHHYHNLLGEMSESCLNPLGCPLTPPPCPTPDSYWLVHSKKSNSVYTLHKERYFISKQIFTIPIYSHIQLY